MPNAPEQYLRRIPSVDDVLAVCEKHGLTSSFPRWILLEATREVLSEKRRALLISTFPENLENVDLSPEGIVRSVREHACKIQGPFLRRVINATGVVVHTNLGRSPLSRRVLDQLTEVSLSYSTLEFDLEKGERGSRQEILAGLVRRLTGAEECLVVNNNAAGVLLALDTLACGKEVIVSRGQLVEIGGSFRIPDVMRKSGAKLVEVGTTNKTRISDYEEAVGEHTALFLKVHTSNFKIVGFVEEVAGEELVKLGRRLQIPVMEDLGSGTLVDLSKYGLSHEPTVLESLSSGIDVITFSGDKLLGSSQSGFVLGKAERIRAMKKNPLTRALRPDKLTLAVLEATLRLYLEGRIEEIPTLRMLTLPLSELSRRAETLLETVRTGLDDPSQASCEEDVSEVGGGALPLQQLPTRVIALRSPRLSPNALEVRFRKYPVPVIGRIQKGRFVLDVRTLLDEDLEPVAQACHEILNG